MSRALTLIADAILRPVSWLPPLAGVLVVSLLTAICLLLVVRAFSDQRRLRAARNGLAAALLELRLFNDDLRASLRAQLEVLRHLGSYWRATLVPVIVLALPFTLVITHLDSYFGYGGLTVGDPALITASIGNPHALDPTRVELIAPEDIRVETPALWFPGSRELVWRITPQAEGSLAVRVRVDIEIQPKTVVVSRLGGRRSPERVAGLIDHVRFPSEPRLPASWPGGAITVSYEPRAIAVFGWHVHWGVVYAIATLLFTLVLRRWFGVVL
jgi:hypothetical protein